MAQDHHSHLDGLQKRRSLESVLTIKSTAYQNERGSRFINESMPEADEVVDDEIKLRLDKNESRENLMQ